MPLMLGMYPKTLKKPSRHSATYLASRSAPKKPTGYLSRTAHALRLLRLRTSLFGTSNLTSAQPAPMPATSASPSSMQQPANFPSSSATLGRTPFRFRQILDITLNYEN